MDERCAPLRASQRPALLPTTEAIHSRWSLLAYGAVALPLSLAEVPILLYLPAFYAEGLKLEPALVGLVFLFARLWDGISDLLIGWLSDRTTSRFGRRKPWVVIGAPFLIFSTWFLCNPPKDTGLTYLCVYSAIFYASFTAVKIPHLSWGTELATDYFERSRVSIFRETYNMLGQALFVLAPLVFLGENPKLDQVLFLFSITTLLLIPPTVFPLAIWVRDPVKAAHVPAPFLTELSELLRHRVLLRFLCGRFVFATEEGICNSLLVFSCSVGLGLTTREFFWMILILYVANLATMPLTMRLSRHLEKHWILAGGVGLQALAYLVATVLPPNQFQWAVALWVFVGIANTAMVAMPPSIVADIIDHGDLLSGERRSGTYVAMDNLLYKLGTALGVGVSFGLLEWIGFDPSSVHHTALDARNIRWLGFGLSCGLCIVASIVYLSHPITRKMQGELRAAIRARQPIAREV